MEELQLFTKKLEGFQPIWGDDLSKLNHVKTFFLFIKEFFVCVLYSFSLFVFLILTER